MFSLFNDVISLLKVKLPDSFSRGALILNFIKLYVPYFGYVLSNENYSLCATIKS